MLLVRTYVAPDSHGGSGLFAAQDIQKGTVITRYTSQSTLYYALDSIRHLAGEDLIHLQRYGYPEYAPDDAMPMVGVLLNMDDARFSNHSITANTKIYPDDPDASIACCDIRKGEEITCNYFEFDPTDFIHAQGIITCKTFLLTDKGGRSSVL